MDWYGEAEEKIIKENVLSDRLHNYICCVVDDNPTKLHSIIRGKEVMGNRNDIKDLIEKFDIEEIRWKVKLSPDIYELLNGDVETSKYKEVEV